MGCLLEKDAGGFGPGQQLVADALGFAYNCFASSSGISGFDVGFGYLLNENAEDTGGFGSGCLYGAVACGFGYGSGCLLCSDEGGLFGFGFGSGYLLGETTGSFGFGFANGCVTSAGAGGFFGFGFSSLLDADAEGFGFSCFLDAGADPFDFGFSRGEEEAVAFSYVGVASF
jgi:hypothetical protein